MNEGDFQLILRAKRQIRRELSLRSFLLFAVVFCAALRFLGLELPLLYIALFVLLLVSLILSSDLIANIGTVSKSDLINLIEKHIHNDPEILTRYSSSQGRD